MQLEQVNLTGQCTIALYFHLLSRGNLTIPSNTITELTCSAFTLLDYYDQFIAQRKDIAVRDGFVHFTQTL